MAKPSQSERVSRWQERIAGAERVYQRWSEDYEVPRLEKYYLGKQWRGLNETEAQKKYVTNLVFPTIETILPSLLFTRPVVRVEPRPSHVDDLGSHAAERAGLIESAIQTKIDDPKMHFAEHTQLALKDAFYAFAVVEVGYTADWIDNPNAGKPVLKEQSDDPMMDRTGAAVTQPPQLLQSEALYIKRIPPKYFRVSVSGKNLLQDNDFVTYGEWHYLSDVKRNPDYKNTSDLQAGGRMADMAPAETSSDQEAGRRHDMVLIWKVWDLRQQVKHVIVDGHDKFLVEDKPWTTLPFAVLKFYEIQDEFYPLPAVYNWLSPQDEINETREMQRTHRRRFTRRYTSKVGNISEPELAKLTSGEDGVVVISNVDVPILAVPDAPLDRSTTVEELQLSKEDFLQISGVGQDARGTQTTDSTATEANIVNQRLQIRENRARVQVSTWLAEIARIMLLTMRDHLQLPFMVQMQNDPFARDGAAQMATAGTWQEITSEQIGDLDVDVKIDVASLSPVSEDQQRAAWNQVLALLTNPALMAILMQPNPANPQEPSPLLRKTLGFYGIKSEQEVREIMRVGQMVLMQQAMMGMAGGGMGAPGGQPGQPAGLPAPAAGVQ